MQKSILINPYPLNLFPLKRKKGAGRKGNFINLFLALSLFLVFTLMVFYVFQVSDLATRLGQMQSYEKKLTKLSHENEMFELTISGQNSISYLENRIKDLDFEKITNIRYIKVVDQKVAEKAKNTAY